MLDRPPPIWQSMSSVNWLRYLDGGGASAAVLSSATSWRVLSCRRRRHPTTNLICREASHILVRSPVLRVMLGGTGLLTGPMDLSSK